MYTRDEFYKCLVSACYSIFPYIYTKNILNIIRLPQKLCQYCVHVDI